MLSYEDEIGLEDKVLDIMTVRNELQCQLPFLIYPRAVPQRRILGQWALDRNSHNLLRQEDVHHQI